MNILKELLNLASISISLFILSLAYSKITTKPIKYTFKKVIIILVSSLIILLFNHFESFILKTIIIIFSFYLPYYLFKDQKEPFELFYVLLAIILANVLDYILSLIIMFLPDTNIIIYLSDPIFTILVPLIILTLFSNKNFKKIITIIQKIILKKKIYLSYIIITLILLTLISYINLNTTEIFIRFILIIIAIIILFIISKLIKYKSQYDLNNIYIKYLSKCLNDYKKNNKELRKYKHNIKNKLLTLNSIPHNLIKDYIENELLDIKTSNTLIETNCLTSFISDKLHQHNFNSKRIIVLNNIKDDAKIINNPKLFITISEVLGITLDNAIEASRHNSKSKIIVELLESKKIITIKIMNDFNNDVIIDYIGKPLYTTKISGTGIGLYSLNTNKRIKTHYQIINNKFLCKVDILLAY